MKVITDILQRCFWCSVTYLDPLCTDLYKSSPYRTLSGTDRISALTVIGIKLLPTAHTAPTHCYGLGQTVHKLHWQAEASVKAATETDRRRNCFSVLWGHLHFLFHTEHEPLIPIQVLLLFQCCMWLTGTRHCQLLQGIDGTEPFLPKIGHKRHHFTQILCKLQYGLVAVSERAAYRLM